TCRQTRQGQCWICNTRSGTVSESAKDRRIIEGPARRIGESISSDLHEPAEFTGRLRSICSGSRDRRKKLCVSFDKTQDRTARTTAGVAYAFVAGKPRGVGNECFRRRCSRLRTPFCGDRSPAAKFA